LCLDFDPAPVDLAISAMYYADNTEKGGGRLYMRSIYSEVAAI